MLDIDLIMTLHLVDIFSHYHTSGSLSKSLANFFFFNNATAPFNPHNQKKPGSG